VAEQIGRWWTRRLIRRWARRMAILACIWLVLVATGTVLHRHLWVANLHGIDHPAWQRQAMNALHMALAPGFAALRVLAGGWGSDRLRAPMFVNGIGWGFWLGVLAMVLEMRWLLLHWPRRSGSRAWAIRGEPNSSRRRFLTDAPLLVAGAVPAAGLIRGTLVEPWDLVMRRYQVPVLGLDPALNGLRLVQLSDTHLGPRIPPEYLQRVVRRALEIQPDMFVLTGDYIHAGTAYIRRAAEIFEPLAASGRPVVGVLGNHDWYGSGRKMSAALREIGVAMIDNGRVFVDAGKQLIHPSRSEGRVLAAPETAALCIAGIGDLLEDRVDLDAALLGVRTACPRVLLSHNPDAAELRAWRQGPRVDLMISGHTHGGQVHVPFLGTPVVPSRYGQKYAGGVVKGPAFDVLISRGIGMSILPVRWGVPPELVEVTLVSA
jgi:uncharacterized protein